MQITSSNYIYRTSSTPALGGGSNVNDEHTSTSSSGATAGPTISIGQALSSLQTSLSSRALDDADINTRHEKLASHSQIRQPGDTLAQALSKGVVNPAEWLSSSDVALFEKTTGGTIKDGVIYDRNGNKSDDPAAGKLVLALYEMRNYGSFDSHGNRYAISGDISAEDLRGFINHYRSNTDAFDMDLLDKAFGILSSPRG